MSSNRQPTLPTPAGSSRTLLRRALGQRLESLREQAKLSQNALACALGVDRGTVSRWERGVTLPSLERLLRLATIFGMPLERLLTQRSAPPPLVEPALRPRTEGRRAD